MEEGLVKITIPLPKDNLAGADTESVWAEPQGDGTYKIKNVPFYAKGISCEDVVEAEPQGETLVFKRIVRHSGHSTYQIYASGGGKAPDVFGFIGKHQKKHCVIWSGTKK